MKPLEIIWNFDPWLSTTRSKATSASARRYTSTQEARASDLLETAVHRIKAGRNLLNSVTCLCVKDAEGHDLEHFANAAHILIQDGCDALDALGWRLDKAAR